MATGRKKFATIRASKDTPLVRMLLTQTANLKLSMREICNATGWKNSSTVSSVLRGNMPIPLDKIKPLAEILKLDTVTLLQAAHPDIFSQMREIFKTFPISENEEKFINLLRQASGGQDYIPETKGELEIFNDLLKRIAQRKLRATKKNLILKDQQRKKLGLQPMWTEILKEVEDEE